MTHSIRTWFAKIVSLIVMIVLIYAALNKFIFHTIFKLELSITPGFTGISNYLTWIIPGTELMIALGLFLHKTKTIALYSCVVIFSFYLISMFKVKFLVPHIRGGILNNLSLIQYAAVDIILLILSLSGLLCRYLIKPFKEEKKDPPDIVFT